jgi:hypothetical protein
MSYATGTHIEMRHGMLPGRTTSPALGVPTPDEIAQQKAAGLPAPDPKPAEIDVDPSADPAPDPLPPAA